MGWHYSYKPSLITVIQVCLEVFWIVENSKNQKFIEKIVLVPILCICDEGNQHLKSLPFLLMAYL